MKGNHTSPRLESTVGWRDGLNHPVAGRRAGAGGRVWCFAVPGLLFLFTVRQSRPAATSVVTSVGLGLLASTDAVARRLPRPIVNGLAAALAVTLTATCAA